MTETIHANSGDLIATFTWLYICAGLGSVALVAGCVSLFSDLSYEATGVWFCIAAIFLFVALVIALAALYVYGVHP